MTLQIEGTSTFPETENHESIVEKGRSSDLTLQSVPEETQRNMEKNSVVKRNPPARNTSRFWFERFLAVIQRQNPSVIDSSFLSQIAPSNEGKLLSQLKYLKVIDDVGRPTQLLSMLNLVGDAQKKGFRTMTEESYSELLSEVKVDKAVPDDVVNYFIRKYSYPRDKAVNASKFFLYLADKGSVSVSKELQTFYSERTASVQSNVTSSSALSVSPITITKPLEKPQKVALREQRTSTKNGTGLTHKTNDQGSYDSSVRPAIQATIEIKLDKDTPRDLWDRVLALLGEKKDAEDQVSETSSDNAGE